MRVAGFITRGMQICQCLSWMPLHLIHNINTNHNGGERYEERGQTPPKEILREAHRPEGRSRNAATRTLAIVSFVFIILFIPDLVCSLIEGCHHVLLKLAYTLLASSSCLHPTILAFNHPTITVVVGHVFHRRWRLIPSPTQWVLRLIPKDTNSDDVC